MNVTDMKLFGDRTKFALGFQLIPDPDQGSSLLRRVSWGRFQIWVSGRNLTVGNGSNQTIVECAEVPLVPLVWWVVNNWEHILYETELPFNNEDSSSASWCVDCLDSLPDDDSELDKLLNARLEWRNRHCMGSSLPDFRLPNLHLRCVNTGIELSWDDREWSNVSSGINLHEISGTAVFPVQDIASVLFDWASSIAYELRLVPESIEFANEMFSLLENHRSTFLFLLNKSTRPLML
jgi:hypothetical protein